MAMEIKVAGIKEESLIDGPGICFVLFLQGCLQDCPGCHNPHARSLEGGEVMTAHAVLREVDSSRGIDSVVFSGGEPFLQAGPLSFIASLIKQRGLRLVIYSGYTYEYLTDISHGNKDFLSLLKTADILIDGPFIEAEKDLSLPYRGSKNQRIIDVQASLRSNKAILMADY